ncbi:winged helix-turn-helix transcriptional regulator [Leucobacter luti]|uniref:winged helix-turn-helix transcriptional regulator n=1 Tax=Leucobacter luti TaxID=340320 RepID=UPI001052984C|nr:winged helix-turn-helix transcriptional regulator [Leucobacter luti]MCW2287056.1 orotate phosphoribosyltransferase-like protein [Leucobacter luti]
MIDRIMALRASGMTYAEIAHTVGLSLSRVGELVRRKERRELIAQWNSSARCIHLPNTEIQSAPLDNQMGR